MKQRFSFFKIALLVFCSNYNYTSLLAQQVHTAVPYLSSVAVANTIFATSDINQKDNSAATVVENFMVTKRVDGAAQLHWSSLSDKIEVSFFIEHSVNGSDFVTVGEIASHAVAQKDFSYDFLHKDASNGVNYYRLRIEAEDGQPVYTEVQKIVVGNKKQPLVIYPNPAIGSTFLSINANDDEKVKVSVLDLAGTEIESQIVIVKKHRASLDVSNTGRGMYTIVVSRTNGEQLRGKLLVAF